MPNDDELKQQQCPHCLELIDPDKFTQHKRECLAKKEFELREELTFYSHQEDVGLCLSCKNFNRESWKCKLTDRKPPSLLTCKDYKKIEGE